jgi:hypothetical protein
MTPDELVDYLVGLTGPAWRVLAAEVSLWRVRGCRGDDAPEDLATALDLVRDEAMWDEIKRRVASRRRKAYRQRVEARDTEAQTERRNYMRDYMRAYRRRGTGEQ